MTPRTAHRLLLSACIAGIFLVMAVTGWYLLNSSRRSQEEAARHALKVRAQELAQQAARPIVTVRTKLAALAREPGVRALFQQGDVIAVAGGAAEYEGRFPDALNLRFLLPGHYTLDNSSKPPLSYASLAMLQKAEKTDSPIGAEAHLFGRPDQHIALVQRVNDQGGQLIGLIHLSLDVSLFKQSLAGLNLSNAYVELHQSAAGRSLILAARGNAAYKQGKPVTASLEDSRWNLAYWPARAPGATGKEAALGLLAPAAGLTLFLLLGVAVAVFFGRRPAGPRDTDAGSAGGVIYAGAVRNIMDGAHPGLKDLVPHLPGGKGGGATGTPSEALSGSDDITMIVNRGSPARQALEEGEMFDLTGGGGDAAGLPASPPAAEAPVEISPVIFRAYDIRGVVEEDLTAGVVELIGRAVGSEAGARGEQAIVVGRDGRHSSPELAGALIKGIRAAGRDVIDVGMVPTPVLYFAAQTLDAGSGVMVTGSHNGPEYNGLKIVLGGDTLFEDGIQRIYQRITGGELNNGDGALSSAEIISDYIHRISEDIPVSLSGSLKLVVDCGNGVTGIVAPQLFRALGHDVTELYCEVDGGFPNHHPDPSQPENLAALIEKVNSEGADLGLAFDGDGDRLGVIDGRGNIIWPDRQLMVLARDVLSRNPGAEIIYDVKCSRHLKSIIESSGGRPLMWKTGHSLIKRRMKEDNALLAGEMSGHIFFKERWYGFDDAVYAAARLLEVIVNAGTEPSNFFEDVPEGVSTPELRIDLPEEQHRTVMQELEAAAVFDDAEIIKVDGLRIEFADGWGLIRPSNTTPCLVLRFEAENREALERIQEAFRGLILSVNPDLKLPF
jgi:phosphomannomutase/phosphoglucomutase